MPLVRNREAAKIRNKVHLRPGELAASVPAGV